ncbi:MAG: undecaprenyldiphospho-muramoylpentapeptide beta-N-acetylglucosaminyltransferase [Deltaproteobacteria bacterium]|jgi:UDP-N-acetylglucosamine--N-acetylmuramyl-(pentapeptide) pyrophosphoryl-undecaprenol N-acetylglucosamine transferase|nr:undecaprenyldiphospho-muramoylpentapeptide beta-N-acetylglucosaminyltransferase [Deltaproteobacteria bacterium]
MRRVILTTGGTGGHIFPALAVAAELRRTFPDIAILFMGGESGPEERLAKQAGLEFMSLPVRGFFGRGVRAVGAGFRLLRGIALARRKIRKFKPDLVIGFGGYAAAAAVAAGLLCGVPTMIHEQNSVPGIANRLLGRYVDKVCISLPEAEKWFKPGKTALTGNPVRRGIRELYRDKLQKTQDAACPAQKDQNAATASATASDRRNLLVLGGSQGAKALNSAVLEDLPRLLDAGLTVRIQAGAADYERVAAALKQLADEATGTGRTTESFAARVSVSAFIEDMREAYAWADLALCRAGATTVAELAVAGLPAIFVPFPFATHNHQLHNAEQVRKLGAALLLEQKDFAPGRLADLTAGLFAEPARLASMSEAALLLANPDAAEKVIGEARKILGSA